jgi:hypothetical protein
MHNPRAIVVLILATALIVLATLWVAPGVGVHNSICERDPYAAGCR